MNGMPSDPWKCLMILPVRFGDSADVHHIELSAKSARGRGYWLFRDIGQEIALHTGEVPVVSLGANTYEAQVPARNKDGSPRIDKKTGKATTTALTVDTPEFEIVGWEAASEGDFVLDASGEEAATDEVGAVETRERTTKAMPKPEAKAAPAKGGKRKVQAVADDEDDI